MSKVPEMFASAVFNETVMRELLPKDIFKALKKTMKEGSLLDASLAGVVANAMKDWAIGKGATHYTHWFQPMTGAAAEKHDSFITPVDDANVIMEFNGKELIRGESDASSFPSGGLRATFEARGYTAWDPTSYAFVREGTLYIPTVFCSFTGQVLDKKTPLLRSMDAISVQACRVLKLFGKDCKRVTTSVGPEQEYFLIDKNDYIKRPDLILTGRTLFGAPAPKGQEMDDHYYDSIRPRVAAYMRDLDEELWKLGILSKTKHNEVAPCQHEMAPIYTNTNIATDHNQLTMDVMKKTAERHGLVCLLHEKPFAGINGSGKHNNWSMSTDAGENLLEPGKTPGSNAQFLLFLTAIVKAVDEYQDALRLSAASAGNDHRLGANEAPPAVISIFLGEELEAIFDSIVSGTDHTDVKKTLMSIGVDALPPIPKDTTDRNRTSPFAFTGNKFEFRMLGSSFNIACTNTIINTAVADVLREFADELEASDNFDKALADLLRREIRAHRRIIFNGNGYSDEWIEEAERRGLSNLPSTPEALVRYTDEKNVALFGRHGVYTPVEIKSRRDILLEEYSKTVRIEARTMHDMLRRLIVPACMDYSKRIAEGVAVKASIGIEAPAERALAVDLTAGISALIDAQHALEAALAAAPARGEADEIAFYYRREVCPAMAQARAQADALENLVGESYWPLPSYRQMLFYV
ncbi:MAG: glutamine synthetase III [Butyricicoccus sp.]|nr:glutamine synthetase III [Butyricicoccus sp.]